MGELVGIRCAAVRRPPLRLVMMSDTHLHHDFPVPDGDVLLHAGDLCETGTLEELERVGQFLQELPHRHKIVIAGNHDFCFVDHPAEARGLLGEGVTYLQDEEIEIEGLRLYGSPWQPWHHNMAFNLRRGLEMRACWSRIPEGIDILMTHGPALSHGDMTSRNVRAGCDELHARIRQVRPKLHVFGHIHEGFGVSREGETVFANASIRSGQNRNLPIVADFDPSTRELRLVGEASGAQVA